MNILLIMADELSTWGLGCYEGTRPHTPHLDALAKRGARFTAAYTPSPMCVPTRAAQNLVILHEARRRMAQILDPEHVNAHTHADQARLIEQLGGREELLAAPQWNFTPADSR